MDHKNWFGSSLNGCRPRIPQCSRLSVTNLNGRSLLPFPSPPYCSTMFPIFYRNETSLPYYPPVTVIHQEKIPIFFRSRKLSVSVRLPDILKLGYSQKGLQSCHWTSSHSPNYALPSLFQKFLPKAIFCLIIAVYTQGNSFRVHLTSVSCLATMPCNLMDPKWWSLRNLADIPW